MQKRKLQNRDLDAIGRNLIRSSGSMRKDEIEKIAAAPHLFGDVNARIDSALSSQQISRSGFAILIRRNATVFATGIIVVLGLTVFGLYIARPRTEHAAIKDRIPEAIPDFARPYIAPQVIDVNGITEGRAKYDRPVAERAVLRQRPRVKRQPAEDEQHAEFYALTYAGDPADSARGGKVIRVDMSRSSLFAMGVNLPLENEADVIKADLMVGADGVARAIRLVE